MSGMLEFKYKYLRYVDVDIVVLPSTLDWDHAGAIDAGHSGLTYQETSRRFCDETLYVKARMRL